MPRDTVPWDELSDSARVVLLRVVTRLADGFTGSVRIDCHDGNVKRLHEGEDFSPKDLVD